ncbi:MAG: hypothetical protein WCK21_09915, partial [Actinomycetota bacterium]
MLAALLFTIVFGLLHATAGNGGLAVGIVSALAFAWLRAWRTPLSLRRQLWVAAVVLTMVTVVWDGITFTKFVLRDNGDSTSQRMTTWARDHGLGDTIDWLETVVYNDPPSKKPARELSLAVPSTTAPPVTQPPTTEQVTTTTIYTPPTPAPLATHFNPLPGEGQWLPVMKANGMEAIWATSVRPLPDTGGVVATVLVIDQTSL